MVLNGAVEVESFAVSMQSMSFLFYDVQGNHTSITITRWKTSE